MYHTYVIYSEKFDRIYVGQTNDLEGRIQQHNAGKIFSTKRYIPWQLIYSEEYQTRADSMKREKELKTHKGRNFIKNELVRVRQLPD